MTTETRNMIPATITSLLLIELRSMSKAGPFCPDLRSSLKPTG